MLPASGAAWRARTPHLNPLPLAKRRGETNAMGLTTGGLLPASGAAWRARTPHLNPLPLAKGRGETNTMGPKPANTTDLAVLP